jgi:hypothetical protein
MRMAFFATLGIALAACSSSATGAGASSSSGGTSEGTLSGSVGGVAFAPTSTSADYTYLLTGAVLAIYIGEKPLACSQPVVSTPNTSALSILVARADARPGSLVVADGDPASGRVRAAFNTTRADGSDAPTSNGVSGTVTLTEVDTRVHGTLDITFPVGHVAGEFDGDICPE